MKNIFNDMVFVWDFYSSAIKCARQANYDAIMLDIRAKEYNEYNEWSKQFVPRIEEMARKCRAHRDEMMRIARNRKKRNWIYNIILGILFIYTIIFIYYMA